MAQALPWDLKTSNYLTLPVTSQWTPGQKVFDERTGMWYRFVQAYLDSDNTNGNTLITGRPMYYADNTKTTVYSGITTGITKAFAGVLQNTVTAITAAATSGGYYTWIICDGPEVPCLITSALAVGGPLTGDPTNGVLKVCGAVTDYQVGQYIGFRQATLGAAYTAGTGGNPATPCLSLCRIKGQ